MFKYIIIADIFMLFPLFIIFLVFGVKFRIEFSHFCDMISYNDKEKLKRFLFNINNVGTTRYINFYKYLKSKEDDNIEYLKELKKRIYPFLIKHIILFFIYLFFFISGIILFIIGWISKQI